MKQQGRTLIYTHNQNHVFLAKDFRRSNLPHHDAIHFTRRRVQSRTAKSGLCIKKYRSGISKRGKALPRSPREGFPSPQPFLGPTSLLQPRNQVSFAPVARFPKAAMKLSSCGTVPQSCRADHLPETNFAKPFRVISGHEFM